MGYTLFSLVTWGALVLLILPERKMDVLQTAVVLLLGMIWIVAKRPRLQKIKFPNACWDWLLSFWYLWDNAFTDGGWILLRFCLSPDCCIYRYFSWYRQLPWC